MTCDKWPKFKEIGTKKNKSAKVVAKERKILARTLGMSEFSAENSDEKKLISREGTIYLGPS